MKNKKQFVEDLSKVLTKHISYIEGLEYIKPGKIYAEEVIVTFYGGYQKRVNVHMDSYLEMLKDIAKQVLEEI